MTDQSPANQAKTVRPPVVVVLGHVDHGKTTLLDTIRKTNVAAKESGSITQHIGAYQTEINGQLITFLDTPGHEAFTAIRSRGAKVADIAILVVAADEGVKPQTKEAIQIIKQEEITVVVAINKTDKEGANPAKVKQDLAGEDILVEEWGGKTPCVEISARQGTGVKELLDMILLVADLEELRQDLSLPARGIIIESHLDAQRGYVATALVQSGIVHQNDWIVVGTVIGKIKHMEDFTGTTIAQAIPSQPVVIVGWPSSPNIGKPFTTARNKDEAEHVVSSVNIDLSPLVEFFKEAFEMPPETNKPVLNVIFKSDVTSSLQAIEAALNAIPSGEVEYRVMDYGTGNITENDVNTAQSTGAHIFGFRVGVETSARKLAEKHDIPIVTAKIIYELVQAVRDEMAALLAPEIQRTVLGKLRVLALFKQGTQSQIVGGKVISGKVVRGALVDLLRNGSPVLAGRLAQLQQNKEDVSEVREGSEAGLRIDASGQALDIKEGDTLEIYEEEKIQRSL